MKTLITLSLLALTACGSNGQNTQTAQTSSPAVAGSHYLLITDQPMSGLAQELTSRGVNVTVKTADSYKTYVANDGASLTGADNQIAGWLNTAQYDGIILSLGNVEAMHYAGYVGPRPYNSFLTVINEINSLNYSGQIVYASGPADQAWAYASNNRVSLGIKAVLTQAPAFSGADLTDAYTPSQAGLTKIADELVTYL